MSSVESATGGAGVNPKTQIPNPKTIPMTKSQIPRDPDNSQPEVELGFLGFVGIWDLGFGISLGLGFWDLGFTRA
jgi:hypothetical protein